jgi:hypothetical protein
VKESTTKLLDTAQLFLLDRSCILLNPTCTDLRKEVKVVVLLHIFAVALQKVSGLVTGGVPHVARGNCDVSLHITEAEESSMTRDLEVGHSLTHQESLCVEYLKMAIVVAVVSKRVDFVTSKGESS